MKKAFLLSAAIAVVAASPAAAQSRRPMPMPAPVFSWTGCYLGVHAGGGTMHDSWASDSEGTVPGQNGSGAVAGGQAGCNYQTGFLVFGVEGEGYWSSLKNSSQSGYTESEGYSGDFSRYTTKNKNDFSIAGRMGVAYERAFLYGKAGWVWGKFSMSENRIGCSDCEGYLYNATGSATLNGLLLGFGLEYALTNNWTIKGEYNYLNFGSQRFAYNYSGTDGPGVGFGVQSADKQIFKIGANYLFSIGPPPPR